MAGVAALLLALVAATVLVATLHGSGDDPAAPGGVPGAATASDTPQPTGATPGTALGATPGASSGTSPGRAASGAGDPPAAATTRLVSGLEQALRSRDVAAARALAGPPPARRLAAALARNAARLDVVGVRLRPLSQTPASRELRRRWGPGTAVSEVEVSWRYAGVDHRPLTSTARVVLTTGPAGTALDGTRPATREQTPPWLLEPLAVRRRGRVLVTSPDAASATRLLTRAVGAAAAVRRRLPDWRGHLVVEAPAGEPLFRAASGLGPAGGRSIAAVTTTADGSTAPGSPERVFLNPRVFAPLTGPAQGIVLRHETTHVAVAAAASAAPLWLTEGFADWVALAGSRLPVRVLASQARALVREEGVPRRLPGRAEFAPGDPDLGAAYESAWVAVCVIARTHGTGALLRFQRLADSAEHVDRAFRVALGTTQAAFTRSWRRALVRLAR